MDLIKTDLDTLLQLKRLEMPTERFWDEFDARLQAHLEQEKMPTVTVPWAGIVLKYMRRLTPAFVCSLLGVICMLNFSPSNVAEQRYSVIPVVHNMNECSRSVLKTSDVTGVVPVKNILHKKIVASNVRNCFSF